MKVKVRKVGNSLTITLPAEISQLLHVGEGDEVFLVEQGQGVSITAYDPEFEQKLAAMKAVAGRYRDTLKALSQ